MLKSLQDTVQDVKKEKARILSKLKNKDAETIIRQGLFTKQLLTESLFSSFDAMEKLILCCETVLNDSPADCNQQQEFVKKDDLRNMLTEMVPTLVTGLLKTFQPGSTHMSNCCDDHVDTNDHHKESYRDITAKQTTSKGQVSKDQGYKRPPPPPKVVDFPLLIEEDASGSIYDVVEQTVLDTNIDIAGSFKSRKGDTVVLCKSPEDRVLLEEKLSGTDINFKVREPLPALTTSISIAGFTKDYSEEDIMKRIKSQNHFINSYLQLHGDDQMKFISLKPTQNNENVFQVTYRVTKSLRQLLRKNRDKVVIGLQRCNVFERYYLKRCNNCQIFHHFYKQCTSEEPYCADCSGNHQTGSVQCKAKDKSALYKCINCIRDGREDVNHQASSLQCPCYVDEFSKLKADSRKNLNGRA